AEPTQSLATLRRRLDEGRVEEARRGLLGHLLALERTRSESARDYGNRLHARQRAARQHGHLRPAWSPLLRREHERHTARRQERIAVEGLAPRRFRARGQARHRVSRWQAGVVRRSEWR